MPGKQVVWDDAPGPVVAQPRRAVQWDQPEQPKSGPISRFVGGVAQEINPLEILPAMGEAALHPIRTAGYILSESGRALKEFPKTVRREGVLSIPKAAIRAVPMVGPSVAGMMEQAESGDVAGGVGRGVGIALATLAGGKAISKIPRIPRLSGEAVREIPGKTARVTGNLARSAAEKNIEQVLGATTKKLKVIASDKVVPGILERGIKANTRKELGEIAAKWVKKYGSEVDSAIQAETKAGVELPTQPIIDQLEGLKSRPDYTLTSAKTGEVTAQRGAPIVQIQEVQDILRKYGDAIRPDDLVAVRKFLDDAVAKKKMAFLVDETKGFEAHAQEGSANLIRDVINRKFPNIAKANNEFAFHKNLQTVIDATLQRTASQSGIVGNVGRLGRGGGFGYMLGGPAGAVTGAGAEILHNTAFYRTRAAGLENRLANRLSPVEPRKLPRLRPRPPSPTPLRPPMTDAEILEREFKGVRLPKKIEPSGELPTPQTSAEGLRKLRDKVQGEIENMEKRKNLLTERLKQVQKERRKLEQGPPPGKPERRRR